MPKRCHVIIINTGMDRVGADLRACPNGKRHARESGGHIGSPLHRVIQWFKTMTTIEQIRGIEQQAWTPFPGKLWQRNHCEHIVCNEKELVRIRKYIRNNPAQWNTDNCNPDI